MDPNDVRQAPHEGPPAGARMYSAQAAHHFVRRLTGCTQAMVTRVLDAQERYEGALGVIPIGYFGPGFDPAAERALAPDLFPDAAQRRRVVSWPLETAYVVRVTQLPIQAVLRILVAESAYCVAVDIMAKAAHSAHEQWAHQAIAQDARLVPTASPNRPEPPSPRGIVTASARTRRGASISPERRNGANRTPPRLSVIARTNTVPHTEK